MVSKHLHGFDTAELTRELEVEPIEGKALSSSKTIKKPRLFLISKASTLSVTRIKDSKKEAKSEAKAKKRRNRKRVTYDNLFIHNGKEYRVNAAKSGLYVEILTKLIEQFELASRKWRRVFALRFDLHTHEYSGNNERITAFRKRLFQRLKREYGFREIGFCWVREMERSKTQHYHWVLFLDGDLIRHSSRVNKMIKDAWEDETATYHVPVIKNPFYFSDTSEIAAEVVYRASYLAKTRGKGFRDEQAKDYQTSRMK
jgi:hypothetical protein